MIKKIYIGADHAGFTLKEKLITYLTKLDFEVIDCGAYTYLESDDYPDFIKPVAQAVAKDSESFGVIIGGSGQGEAICANRFKGVRASVYYGHSFKMIKTTREHNDANILSIGARFVKDNEARSAVKIFIETKFGNEIRHLNRLTKLEEL